MQANFRSYRSFPQQRASDPADPHCTGGMGAGRPDHNRTDDIKNIHNEAPCLSGICFQYTALPGKNPQKENLPEKITGKNS